MNEDKLKEILEKSKLETSNDFTEKLICKIETKNTKATIKVWPATTLLAVTVILILASYLLYQLLGSRLIFFSLKMDVLKMPFFLAASILFLLTINYIIKLNETINRTIN